MTDDPDQLERLIGALLAEQPPARAPASLQARVLAAVQARSATTASAGGFIHWPRFAQVTFVLAALLVVKLTLLAVDWGVAVIDRALAPADLYQGAAQEVSWIWSLGAAVATSVHSIPEQWLWSAYVVVASVYLGGFAVSALAYRALYAR